MNVQQVLIFCLVSASTLARSLGAPSSLRFIKLEGDVFREVFSFPTAAPGSRKYLCRNECEPGDVLVETTGNRVVRDRFTIRYNQSHQGALHVEIAGLQQSDTGRYRVGIDSSPTAGVLQEFNLKVRDLCDGGVTFAEPRVYRTTEGGGITVRCSLLVQPRNRKFLCRDECKTLLFDTNDANASSGKYRVEFGNPSYFNVTIGQLSRSDSGPYRCGVGRQGEQHHCQQFEITVSDAGNTLPVVAVCVSAVVLLSVVSLLFVYRRRTRRNDAQYANTRRNTANTETATYDDCYAGSGQEASTYQELDVHSREDNLYSELETLPNYHR